ncbi:MAG: TonB-dependent receptor [Bacteroidetes bacterium]|nr:TonB-dependent receptor [Bacteroidota bacterium]
MRKILFFFLNTLFLQIGLAQSPLDVRTDFHVEDVSVSEALKKLARDTKTDIAFSNRFFKNTKKVTCKTENESVSSIITRLLSKTNIGFKTLESQIILFRKQVKSTRNFTISGYVEDSQNGERLISAAVYEAESGKGTFSNEYGFYSLTLPEGTSNLTYRYLGYSSLSREVILDSHQKIDVALNPSLTLAEIIVTPKQNRDLLPPSPENEIGIHQIESSPELGGEPDLMRTLLQLTGVESGADGLGGMFVRGGSADQNLILLDGVSVYNPSHLLGLFSIFNTNAIRKANFIKGNFPARYGGRISSVLDVRTREGNQKQWSSEVGLGLISGKATVEGPLFNKKGALLLAGRTTHSDFFLGPISRKAFFNGDIGGSKYQFHDFNSKINLSISDKDRLFWSFYTGKDIFNGQSSEEFNDEQYYQENFESDLSWGNIINSFRWNHQFNHQLFLNTTLTFSRFASNNFQLLEVEEEDEEDDETIKSFFYYEYNSEMKDFSLLFDFDFFPSFVHQFRFGGGYTNHFFQPGAVFFDSREEEFIDEDDEFLTIDDFSEFYEAPQFRAHEFFAYFEDEYRPNQNWQFNFGIRTSSFYQDENLYFFPEPRFEVNYKISENLNVHASANRMVQFLHLLSPTGLSLPNDVWIPSTEEIPPQDSWQGELGLHYSNDHNFEMSLEGYYKTMDNLLGYQGIDSTFSFESKAELESETFSGQGWSYGLEYFVRKKIGNTGGQLGYTLAWSNRQFDNLNLGNEFVFEFDRRHSIKFYFFHKLTETLTFSANWVYGSANPRLQISNDEIIFDPRLIDNADLGKKNSIRSKEYHRLDLGLNWHFGSPKIQHKAKFSIYNLYNHKNIAFHRLAYDEDLQQPYFEPVNMLPVMPSVSYNLKF